jgi:putative nucleotidyltransferase with HDIG domain
MSGLTAGKEKTMDQPVRVLFVDDEENIINSLRRLFHDEDFETLTATSGAEGIEILKNNDNIGLIVSDQRMPGLSGVDFLEQARKITPEAIRIVLTGYADIEAAMGAINRGGAYRYLSKPWDDDNLVQNIREAVDLFTLKQENSRLTEIVKEQNKTLAEWNSRLKSRVIEQNREIVERNEKLSSLNIKLKENFQNSIAAFANLIELRNKTSGSHSKYVAELSARIAESLRLSASEIETIHTAGLLHDIGKIGISEDLLNKKLSDMSSTEQEEYKSHAVRGQSAIASIEDLQEVGILIRHHHEWFNGEGWPDNLRQHSIPIGSRIICMADYVDKIMTYNPTSEIISHVQLKVKNKSRPDGMFDPDLYPLLEAHIESIYGDSKLTEKMTMVEVDPSELLPGMTLARKILSGTGLLLIDKGKVLDDNSIKSLQRYYVIDPPENKIYVWK